LNIKFPYFDYKKELELKSKILNKPIELLEFDALTHFKENIAHTYKNFLGAITEKSYYCLDCKHSDCPFYNNDPNQKEHRLIKKVKLYTYDNKFFNEVEKTINEYNNIKSLSIVEVRYKLLAKGINKDIIEEYIDNNKYALEEYEVKSAKNIIQKKRKNMDDNDIKIYLIKKGYKQDNIREALESED